MAPSKATIAMTTMSSTRVKAALHRRNDCMAGLEAERISCASRVAGMTAGNNSQMYGQTLRIYPTNPGPGFEAGPAFKAAVPF